MTTTVYRSPFNEITYRDPVEWLQTYAERRKLQHTTFSKDDPHRPLLGWIDASTDPAEWHLLHTKALKQTAEVLHFPGFGSDSRIIGEALQRFVDDPDSRATYFQHVPPDRPTRLRLLLGEG